MCSEIQLTQGKVAIIDDDDMDLVQGFTWKADKGLYTFYANTPIPHPVRTELLPSGRKPRTVQSMHRLLMGLSFGDKRCVDHIDGNGLNNQRANLRIATTSQNAMNKRSQSGSTSSFKGVSFNRQNRKWQAIITVNGTTRRLGNFDTEEEAALRYDEAARYLHGEFAMTNGEIHVFA